MTTITTRHWHNGSSRLKYEVVFFFIIFYSTGMCSLAGTTATPGTPNSHQETYNICIWYIAAELGQVIPGQLYKRKVPEYLTVKVLDFFAKNKPH
jgi:hypothetical protein